jgi:hypothetical protein
MGYNAFRFAVAALVIVVGLSACDHNQQPVTTAPTNASQPVSAPSSGTTTDCGPMPYTVGWTDINGAVAAQLVRKAKNQVAASPPSVNASGDIKRVAYAGMVSQAMTLALDNYECSAKNWLVQNNQPAATTNALTQGFNRLRATIFDYGDQIATDPKTFKASDPSISGYVRHPDADRVIPTNIMSQALPTPNFTTREQFTGQLSGGIGPLSLGACGSVVRAAVQDGGPYMAVALASLRTVVINYFNPDSPSNPATAFITLAGNMKAVPATTSVSAADTAGCKASLPPHPA